MDPNLFRLDWERTFEVLVAIILLAFFLERALALLFEHRVFLSRFDRKGLKEPIAFAGAFLVCWQWDFDAVSMIVLRETTTLLGQAITAGIIAGGSKAAVKLFRDIMGVRSLAHQAKYPSPGGPQPASSPQPPTPCFSPW